MIEQKIDQSLIYAMHFLIWDPMKLVVKTIKHVLINREGLEYNKTCFDQRNTSASSTWLGLMALAF